MKKPEITLDELRDMASKYPNDGPVGGMRGIVLQLCDHLGEMQAANDAIASDFGERTVLLRDAVEKLGGKVKEVFVILSALAKHAEGVVAGDAPAEGVPAGEAAAPAEGAPAGEVAADVVTDTDDASAAEAAHAAPPPTPEEAAKAAKARETIEKIRKAKGGK